MIHVVLTRRAVAGAALIVTLMPGYAVASGTGAMTAAGPMLKPAPPRAHVVAHRWYAAYRTGHLQKAKRYEAPDFAVGYLGVKPNGTRFRCSLYRGDAECDRLANHHKHYALVLEVTEHKIHGKWLVSYVTEETGD